jgi:hypothetical protein
MRSVVFLGVRRCSAVCGGKKTHRYQYRVKNNRGDKRYWEGIVPLCPATINTHWETITKSANYHKHVPNSARVKSEAVINIIKGRCIKATTPIPTKVKKYTTLTSNYSKPLVNNINFR